MRSRLCLMFSYFNDSAWFLSWAIVEKTKDHIRCSFKESNALFPAHAAPAMLQTNELLFHFSPAYRANLIALSHIHYPMRISSCGAFNIFVMYSYCRNVKPVPASSIVWTGLPSTSSTASWYSSNGITSRSSKSCTSRISCAVFPTHHCVAANFTASSYDICVF